MDFCNPSREAFHYMHFKTCPEITSDEVNILPYSFVFLCPQNSPFSPPQTFPSQQQYWLSSVLNAFILDHGCSGQHAQRPGIIIKIPLDLRFFGFVSLNIFFQFVLSQAFETLDSPSPALLLSASFNTRSCCGPGWPWTHISSCFSPEAHSLGPWCALWCLTLNFYVYSCQSPLPKSLICFDLLSLGVTVTCLVCLHHYTGPGMRPASHGRKRKTALGYCLCFSSGQ